MRIRRRSEFVVHSGTVAIVDPCSVFNTVEQYPHVAVPPNAVCFDSFGGDGNFKVYASADCLVVDTAPRQFKHSTRSEFERVRGEVAVDSGMIVFVDLVDAPIVNSNPITCVTHDLEAGNYVAWLEENENSMSQRRVILGLGKTPHLFLAGNDATTIDELEQEIATVLRLKGAERQDRIRPINDAILELHLGGCRDRRLRMLADATKLQLPRRPARR